MSKQERHDCQNIDWFMFSFYMIPSSCCKENYTPELHLTVDKQLLAFKGFFKMYTPTRQQSKLSCVFVENLQYNLSLSPSPSPHKCILFLITYLLLSMVDNNLILFVHRYGVKIVMLCEDDSQCYPLPWKGNYNLGEDHYSGRVFY